MGSWSLWRTVRVAASVLVLMTALYYLIVAFDNITNPASNWSFVKGVLSGDGTPPNDGFEWREVHATWFQVVSYVGIITCETLTGLLLAVAGAQGLKRAGDPDGWVRAQRLTFAGGMLGLVVFYVGFMSVGGNWFIMYLNGKWNGLDPAFQNSVMTLLTLLFVGLAALASRTEREGAEREGAGR